MSDTSWSVLPWLLIFSALLVLWFDATRKWTLPLLIGGYVLALIPGQLGVAALPTILFLGAAAWAVQPGRRPLVRVSGHITFVLIVLLLRQHVAPGFNNPLVLSGRVSELAPEFRMYLNLDKLLIPIWILWGWRQVEWGRASRGSVLAGVEFGLSTAAACIGIGALTGLVSWEPKWPPEIYIWALNNLLLVCLGEEALFRSYIQGGLARRWQGKAWGDAAALMIGACLFGLAHYASGPMMMAVSTLSGIGYGLAYRAGGLRAATLAHMILNLGHFTLFTYPMIAPTAGG